jgi:hypothetical protein
MPDTSAVTSRDACTVHQLIGSKWRNQNKAAVYTLLWIKINTNQVIRDGIYMVCFVVITINNNK